MRNHASVAHIQVASCQSGRPAVTKVIGRLPHVQRQGASRHYTSESSVPWPKDFPFNSEENTDIANPINPKKNPQFRSKLSAVPSLIARKCHTLAVEFKPQPGDRIPGCKNAIGYKTCHWEASVQVNLEKNKNCQGQKQLSSSVLESSCSSG